MIARTGQFMIIKSNSHRSTQSRIVHMLVQANCRSLTFPCGTSGRDRYAGVGYKIATPTWLSLVDRENNFLAEWLS